ncbi:U-box domain-containing protein [Legionella hackeliae]|uniref:U-box domain-containing protein n=1 Tax=Legionella hackeliae TaxID=449 RepID=A0A0A8UP96_LEGHA|nr:U-box domain-containing protein [Legionella hackeliae]KTD13511.1 U-box domain protein [Legionella hackeliae]CEK09356.1 protein of unknown function [U-box domain] [Legionella hackeliae]STX49262.1 U-box domain [Legionella hackeliae]
MLYVIVNLPPRVRFNPFLTSTLFDVFQQVKNQAKQEHSSYITYGTKLEQVNEHISGISNHPSRILVLQMQINNRYEIPGEPMNFIKAVKKADFHLGAFHKEIALALPIVKKPVTVSVPREPLKSVSPKLPDHPIKKIIQNHPGLQMPSGVQKLPENLQKVIQSKSEFLSKYKSSPPLKKPSVEQIKQIPKPVVLPQIPKPAPVVQPRPLAPRPPVVAPIPPVAVPPRPQVEEDNRVNLPEIPVQALPIPPQPQPLVDNVNRLDPEIPEEALPVPPGRLGHVPYPARTLAQAAKKVADEHADELPVEFMDPITMEPLTDPIEINRRVYDRDTAEGLIKQGQFQDPFTREAIDPATAKPAHYMLEAMSEHLAVMKKEEPKLPALHKDTTCIPLKALFEQWEEMLKMPVPAV